MLEFIVVTELAAVMPINFRNVRRL